MMRTTSLVRSAALVLAGAACTSAVRGPAPAPGVETPPGQPRASLEPPVAEPGTEAPPLPSLLPGSAIQVKPSAPMPVYCPSSVPYMPVAPGADTDPFMPRGPIVPSACPPAKGSSLALGPDNASQGLYSGQRIRIRGRSTVDVDSTVRLAPGVEKIILPNGAIIQRQPKPQL